MQGVLFFHLLGAICTRLANDAAECQRPAAVGITEEPSGTVYTLFPCIRILESSV